MCGSTSFKQLPSGVLYQKEERREPRVPWGYVFLCSNRTEGECLEKKLFGSPKSEWGRVSQVKEGDILFLLNYQTNHLHGVFEAVSEGKMDIDPDAFDGRFPAQVKARRMIRCHWVGPAELLFLIRRRWIWVSRRGIIRFPTRFGPKLINELFRIFLQIPTMPPMREGLAGYRAKDGHIIGSYGERVVDDWLRKHLPYKHHYNYAVERGDERLLCDWYIPDIDLYVEYWEQPVASRTELGETYEMHRKRRFYEAHSLKAIDIYEDDLPRADRIISTKIGNIVPECKFRNLAKKTKSLQTSRKGKSKKSGLRST